MSPNSIEVISADTDIQNLNKIRKVVVHPLVLLSVVDHFNRSIKSENAGRVVGVLLGSKRHGILDVSNSFAVPFEEDEKDDSIWFLDHEYLENVYNMFRKVNAREKIVGWYHTGPKLRRNDVDINGLFKRFNPNSILVIIGAKPKDLGLPTEAYVMTEQVHDDGTPTTKTFDHVPSEIGAEEAEEVGVEHLLRDIKDTAHGSLSQQVTAQLHGLKGLHSHLNHTAQYLQDVTSGDMPVNHQILYLLQDIFNLLPDVSLDEFISSMHVTTNDQMLVVYLASVIRTVIATHNLIDNKIANRDAERGENEKGQGDDKKKTGEKTDVAEKETQAPTKSKQ